LAFLAAVIIFTMTQFRTRRENTRRSEPKQELTVLLHADRVFDFSPDAPIVMEHRLGQGTTWEDLREDLIQRFPDLPEHLSEGHLEFVNPQAQDMVLTLHTSGQTTRLAMRADTLSVGQRYDIEKKRTEARRLAQIIHMDPNPSWEMDDNGQMLWNNHAYDSLSEYLEHNDPDRCLFDLSHLDLSKGASARVHVDDPDKMRHWFEVTGQKTEKSTLYFANPINSLVEAEMAQRNFVQTLTKTFAHLPTGLAVFDKNHQLVLFNPALLELTRLPVDFLSARPTLHAFFDRIRDNRMMPEPKSYSSWREKLYDVISAAREDRYNETWNLPSGLTYKITGRPHPDGAVAFLLEDISAEITLTRRFRSELALTQSVVDRLTDSVAVFSRLGVLTFSNDAYRKQWPATPAQADGEITILDSTRAWQDACLASDIWPDIREFVLTMQMRKPWEAELTCKSGAKLLCRVDPVASGATMVRFKYLTPAQQNSDQESQPAA
jgi:PAS domain-containing protein